MEVAEDLRRRHELVGVRHDIPTFEKVPRVIGAVSAPPLRRAACGAATCSAASTPGNAARVAVLLAAPIDHKATSPMSST